MELIACIKAIEDMFPRRRTIEEEHATDGEMRALADRLQAAKRHLENLGAPVTLAGAAALSRAVLADAYRDADGDIPCESFTEWASFTVVQWIEQHGDVST